MKMQSVMTLRLTKEDLKVIEDISTSEKKDKSTTARELVRLGKIYFAIIQYKNSKISIERAAKIAGLTISEMMDLLEQLGIKSELGLEDYLEGESVAKEIIS